MAKVTITFEDRHDGNGAPIVEVDMTGVPTNAGGQPEQTSAVRMSKAVFDMVASRNMRWAMSACRWHPCNETVN